MVFDELLPLFLVFLGDGVRDGGQTVHMLQQQAR